MDRLEKQVEEGEDFRTITLWPVNSEFEFECWKSSQDFWTGL